MLNRQPSSVCKKTIQMSEKFMRHMNKKQCLAIHFFVLSGINLFPLYPSISGTLKPVSFVTLPYPDVSCHARSEVSLCILEKEEETALFSTLIYTWAKGAEQENLHRAHTQQPSSCRSCLWLQILIQGTNPGAKPSILGCRIPGFIFQDTLAEHLTRFRGKTLFSLLPCRVSLERAAPPDTFVSMCSAFSISSASNFSITWDLLENRDKRETRDGLNTRAGTVRSCTTPQI